MNSPNPLPVQRGEIPDLEWAIQRLGGILYNAATTDAFREVCKKQTSGEATLQGVYQVLAEELLLNLGSGVMIDLANATLIPGLRAVNDEIEDAIGKVVVLERNSATRALEKVYLVETEPIEQELSIIVNGAQKTVGKSVLSYDEIALLAWPTSEGKNIPWTMTYCRCKGPKREGSLIRGESVKIRDGAMFEVVVT